MEKGTKIAFGCVIFGGVYFLLASGGDEKPREIEAVPEEIEAVPKKVLENAGAISGAQLLRDVGSYNRNFSFVTRRFLDPETREYSDAQKSIEGFESFLRANRGKRFEFECEFGAAVEGAIKEVNCYPSSFHFTTSVLASRLQKKTVLAVTGVVKGEKVFKDDKVSVVGTLRGVEKTELPKFCTKYECNTQYVYGAKVLIDEASVTLL